MRPDSAEAATAVPDPAVVVLIGLSGSGKSAWAAETLPAAEMVSSDQLRAIVGSGEHDLDASADAFALLDQIVAARVGRGLTTVIDTLGLEPARRRGYPRLARREADCPASWCCSRRRPGRGAGRATGTGAGPVPAACAPRAAAAAARRPISPAERSDDGSGLSRSPAAGQARARRTRPGAGSGRRRAAQRPARLGFVLQISRFGWADDPPGWLAAGRQRRGRGRSARHRADGPPDPDPAGRPGLGADPRAVGHARPAGRPGTRPAARHAGHAGDVPRARDPGQDRRHAGRAQRRPGVLRHRRGLVGPRARRVRPAVPAAATRLDQLEAAIETLRALWQPGTKAYHGEPGVAAGDDLLPAAGPRQCRSSSAVAASGARCGSPPGSATAATCPRPRRARPQAGGPARALRARPGRDPEQVQ